MQYDIDFVKEYLAVPGLLHRRLAVLRENKDALYAQSTKTTTIITGMPSGGNSDKGAILAAAVDSKDKWLKFSEESVKLDNKVREFIYGGLDNMMSCVMMECRYIREMSWPSIKVLMEDMGENHCMRLLYARRVECLNALAEYVIAHPELGEEMERTIKKYDSLRLS